jgi:hypothetical protein
MLVLDFADRGRRLRSVTNTIEDRIPELEAALKPFHWRRKAERRSAESRAATLDLHHI